ncbi:hypothetical protein, partial [Klebsiella pneumoniae]|uniref:hypothetical protein n=1 Tax=Klebsiella pneumoniae TaxID=573 RepID=UPI0025A282AF
THAAGYSSTTFTVVKNESRIDSVVASGEVLVGNNVTVNVTMVEGITSGTVLIEINGTNYTVAVGSDRVAR